MEAIQIKNLLDQADAADAMAAQLVEQATAVELQQLESTIEKNLKGFIDVGNALLTIREKRLYRETHSTFDAYCLERWDFGRNYANKQIQAAQVVEALGVGTIVPKTETQARELAPLLDDPDILAEVWSSVVEANVKPTAAIIKEAVEKVKPKPAPTPRPPANPTPVTVVESPVEVEVPTPVTVVEPRSFAELTNGAKKEAMTAECRQLLDDLRSVVQRYETRWGHFNLLSPEEYMEWVELVNDLERARMGEFDEI